MHLVTNGARVSDWWSALTTEHSSALAVIGVALVAFPKLALGLSGFETGVLVMPQVADGKGSAEERLARRISGTRRLLATAAGIMAGLLNLVFAATTVANMVERPDGLKIAACFIASVLIVSLVSRVLRSYELRATGVTFDETAAGFLRAAVPAGVINVIANEPNERDQREYLAKWQEEREINRVPYDQPTVFLEVSVADASEFEADLEIRGEERFGYRVLTVSSTAVANGIAAICLAMRDQFGLVPHVYFDWTEGSPLVHFLRFILWGSGEVAQVTREVLRRAEPDRSRRPHVHVG